MGEGVGTVKIIFSLAIVAGIIMTASFLFQDTFLRKALAVVAVLYGLKVLFGK